MFTTALLLVTAYFSAFGEDPPTYTVNNAVVTGTSVTLGATVDPNGSAGPKGSRANVLVYWRYGLTTAYSAGNTALKAIGMGSMAEDVSVIISRKAFRTPAIYHYQLAVSSTQGILFGPDQMFSIDPPGVTGTTPVDMVYGSTLSATVNPNLNDTDVCFRYGLTTAYSSGTTPMQDVGSGTAGVLVSATLSGLEPNTLYHYQIVTANALGTVYGADQKLATLPLYGTTVLVSTKSPAPGIANAVFTAFGNPAINDMDEEAFQAVVAGPSIGAPNNSGIWAGASPDGLTLIARTGSAAPGYGGAGSVGAFAALSDPVYSNDNAVAFLGTLTAGSGKTGIWVTTSGTLALVARTGDEAPDEYGAVSPVSPRFGSFLQFVLPDQGGVVFLATLAPGSGVSSASNLGIWAVDTDGLLKQVVRLGNGVSLNGTAKAITGLTVFTAPAESTGQTRDFNTEGDLLYKILLSDKSTSIVQTVFP
jgi:hypothetical protein